MRPEHSVFPGSAKLAVAWDHSDHPNQPNRVDPLLTLASHRSQLPGAVFFDLPVGVDDHPVWQEIVDSSVSHCKCPSRRIIFPTRGRDELLSRKPREKTITIGCDFSSQPVAGMDIQMAIGPHGGVHANTVYAMWTISSGGILIEQRPFMFDVRHDVPQIWNPEYGADGTTRVGYRPSEFFISLEAAAESIERFGGLMFLQEIPGLQGAPERSGCMPLCTLKEVVVDDDRELVRAKFEVDATTMVFTALDGEDMEPHTC